LPQMRKGFEEIVMAPVCARLPIWIALTKSR
jgi:hypothetical protein